MKRHSKINGLYYPLKLLPILHKQTSIVCCFVQTDHGSSKNAGYNNKTTSVFKNIKTEKCILGNEKPQEHGRSFGTGIANMLEVSK